MVSSIRTFLLLALTFVAVKGSKRDVGKIILQESIENVDKILKESSEKILNQFVKNIFQEGGCSGTTLCRAAVVLSNTHLNHTLIHRQLFAYAAYTGHQNCSIQASEECTMKDLLTKIKDCCRKQNINPVQHKKHVK